MELDSRFNSLLSYRGNYFKRSIKLSFQSKWLKNKGAILVLIWSFLGFSVFHYLTIINVSQDPIKQNPGVMLSIGIFLPVGGWLADAYFGRYRMICFGLWTMFSGVMLNGLSLVIGGVVETYANFGDPWVSLFSKIIMGVGFGAFQANIIQFGIDQLIDASSAEITSFILWYTMTTFISSIVMQFSTYCSKDYVGLLVLAMFLSLALISNFFINHWVNKEQVISNPLPLIVKVVHITMKLNCQQPRRNCLGQGLLSNLNVTKNTYGGPFTCEQVEDVKTFFRVITVISVFMMVCSGLSTVPYVSRELARHLQNLPDISSLKGCFQELSMFRSHHIFAVVVVLIYVFIHPMFHSCIPTVSITTKFSFSMLLLLASVLALLGIESAAYVQQVGLNKTTCKCIFQYEQKVDIDFEWVIIPFGLNGLSIFLFIFSGIEFICAQAPFNMKGLVLGIACGLFGLCTLIQSALLIPFLKSHIWQDAPLTCGIWYFMIQGVIVLIGFIMVVVIFKLYKKRTRISISQEDDSQEFGSVEMSD